MESGSEVWVRSKSDLESPTSKKETWTSHVVLSKFYLDNGSSSILTKNPKLDGVPSQFNIDSGVLESDDLKVKNDVTFGISDASDLSLSPVLNEPELLAALKRCCYTKVSHVKLSDNMLITLQNKKSIKDSLLKDFVTNVCPFSRESKNANNWNHLNGSKKFMALQNVNKSFALKSVSEATNRSMIDLSSVLNEESGNSNLVCVDRSILVCGESNIDKSQLVSSILGVIGEQSSSIKESLQLAHSVLCAFTSADSAHSIGQNLAFQSITCQFDEDDQLIGGEIQPYIVDYRRVVSQASCERNYSVFYLLLDGVKNPSSDLAEHFGHLQLSGGNSMNYCKQVIASQPKAFALPELLDALTQLDIPQDAVERVMELLAGLLHCGQIELVPTFDLSGEGSAVASGSVALANAVQLLGVDKTAFEQAITTRTTLVVKGESIEKKLDVIHAKTALDNIVTLIYRRIIDYLVKEINIKLVADADHVQSSVHVLDMLPFVNHTHAGVYNNFYNLFVNYSNEFIHRLSISHMLKYIILDGEAQDISPYYEKFDFSGPTSLSGINRRLDGCFENITVNIIDSLDEMCKLQAHPTDKNFAVKLYSKINSSDLIGSLASTLNNSYQYLSCSGIQQQHSLFTIRHYYTKVEYSLDGFTASNYTDISSTTVSVLSSSSNQILRGIANPHSTGSVAPPTPKSAKKSPMARTNSFIPSPKGSSYQLVTDEDRAISPKRTISPMKSVSVQINTPATTAENGSGKGLKRVGSQFIDPNEKNSTKSDKGVSPKRRESPVKKSTSEKSALKRVGSKSNVNDRDRSLSPKPSTSTLKRTNSNLTRDPSPGASLKRVPSRSNMKSTPKGDSGKEIAPVTPSRTLSSKMKSGGLSFLTESNNANSGGTPRAVKVITTISMQYRDQLSALYHKINNSIPHYIYHILPIDPVSGTVSMARKDEFNPQRVAQQLQYCGVWEYVRLSRQYFPIQFIHALFIERYKCLVNFDFNAPSYLQIVSLSHKECSPQVARQRCIRLCHMLISHNGEGPLDPTFLNQIGVTKVFLKATDYIFLENSRYFAVEYLQSQLSFRVNALVLRFIARRRLRKKRRAVINIQRIVRGGMSRRYYKMLFAIVKIQKFIFKYCMNRNSGERAKKREAAVVIQKRIRGGVTRMRMKLYKILVKAVIAIQIRFRNKRNLRGVHHIVCKMRKCVIKIQCAYRRWSALHYVRYINEVMNGHNNMSGDVLVACEIRSWRRRQHEQQQRALNSKSGSYDEYDGVVVAEMESVLDSVDRSSLMLEYNAKIQMFRENTYEMSEDIRAYTTPPEVKPAREEVPPLRCDVEKARKYLHEYTDKYVVSTCDLFHEVMFLINTLDFGYNILLADRLIPLKFIDKLFNGCAAEEDIPVELRKRSAKSAPTLKNFDSDHPVFSIIEANIETLKGIIALAEAELSILTSDVSNMTKNDTTPQKEIDFENEKSINVASGGVLFKKKRAVYYMTKIRTISEQLREYYSEYVTQVVRTFGLTSTYYRDFKEDHGRDGDPYVYHLACLFNEKRPLLHSDKLRTIGVDTVASPTKVIYSKEELPLNDFIKDQNVNRCFTYKGLLIKYTPYAPGIEFTVNSLFHILCKNRYIVCSKLVRGIAHPYGQRDSSYQSDLDTTGLFSLTKYSDYSDAQTMSGSIVPQLTLRDVYSNPILVEQLDGNTLSACILLSMILAAAVIHPSNVLVQSTKSEIAGRDSTIRIVGLSNDADFTQGLFSPRLGHTRRAQRYLNCLYYLPQMDEPVDKSLFKLLTGGKTRAGGHTSSVEVVVYWLYTLATQMKHYESLGMDRFSRGDIKSLNLPFRLPQGSVLGVFQRLQVICSVLMQPNTQVTHQMLLEELFPEEAQYYFRKRNITANIDPQSRLGLFHSRFARNNGEKLESTAATYDLIPYHILVERAYSDAPVLPPPSPKAAPVLNEKPDSSKKRTHFVLRTVTEKVKTLERKKSIKLYPKTIKKLVTVMKKRMVQKVIQVPKTITEMVEQVRTIVIEQPQTVPVMHLKNIPAGERETDSESPVSDDGVPVKISPTNKNGHQHSVPHTTAHPVDENVIPLAFNETIDRTPEKANEKVPSPVPNFPSMDGTEDVPTAPVVQAPPQPERRVYELHEFEEYEEYDDEDDGGFAMPRGGADESFYNSNFSDMLNSLSPLKNRPNNALKANTEANKSLSSYSLLGSNSVFSSEYNMNQSFIANNGANKDMRKNSFLESLPRVPGESFMYTKHMNKLNEGNDFMESLRRVPSTYIRKEYSPVDLSPNTSEPQSPVAHPAQPVANSRVKKGVSFHTLAIVEENEEDEAVVPSGPKAGENQSNVQNNAVSDVRTDFYLSPSATAAQSKAHHSRSDSDSSQDSDSLLHLPRKTKHVVDARHVVDNMSPVNEIDEDAYMTDGSSKKHVFARSSEAIVANETVNGHQTQTIVEMVEVTKEIIVDETIEVEEEYEEEVVVDEVIQIEREIEVEVEVWNDVTSTKYIEEELPEDEQPVEEVTQPVGADDEEEIDAGEAELAKAAMERYHDASLTGLQRYVATLQEVASEFMNAIDFNDLANNDGMFQNNFIKETKRADAEKALCGVIGSYVCFVTTLCLNKINEKQLIAIFSSDIKKTKIPIHGTSLLMSSTSVRAKQSVSFMDQTVSTVSAAGEDMKPAMMIKVVEILNVDHETCNALMCSKIVKDMKTFLGIEVKFSSMDNHHDDFKSSAAEIVNAPKMHAAYEDRDELTEISEWMLQYKELMLKLPLYLPAKMHTKERDIISLVSEQSRTKQQIEQISVSLLKQYTDILLQFPSLVPHTCLLITRGVFRRHRLMIFKILASGVVDKYLEVLVYMVCYNPSVLWVKSVISKHYFCDKLLSISNYRSYKYPLLTICVNKSACLNAAMNAEEGFDDSLTYMPIVSSYYGEQELTIKAVAYGLNASEEELAQRIYHFDKTYKKTGETIFHRTVMRITRPGDIHDQIFFLALNTLRNRSDSEKEVEHYMYEKRTTLAESVWSIAIRRKAATAHIIKELNENWGGRRRISTPSGRSIAIPSISYSTLDSSTIMSKSFGASVDSREKEYPFTPSSSVKVPTVVLPVSTLTMPYTGTPDKPKEVKRNSVSRKQTSVHYEDSPKKQAIEEKLEENVVIQQEDEIEIIKVPPKPLVIPASPQSIRKLSPKSSPKAQPLEPVKETKPASPVVVRKLSSPPPVEVVEIVEVVEVKEDHFVNRKLPEVPLVPDEEIKVEEEIVVPSLPISSPPMTAAYLSKRKLPMLPPQFEQEYMSSLSESHESPRQKLETRQLPPVPITQPFVEVVKEEPPVVEVEKVIIEEVVEPVEVVPDEAIVEETVIEEVQVLKSTSEDIFDFGVASFDLPPLTPSKKHDSGSFVSSSGSAKRVVVPIEISLSRESSAASLTGGDLVINTETFANKLASASSDSNQTPKSQPSLVVIPLSVPSTEESPSRPTLTKSESNKSIRVTRSLEEELVVKAVAYGLLATKDELNNKIYNFDKTYLKTGENILHSALLNIIEKNDSHDRTFFLALRVLRERIKNNKMTQEAADDLIWNVRTVPLNENLWNIAQRRKLNVPHVIEELNENWNAATKSVISIAATSVPFSPIRSNSEKVQTTPQSPGRSLDEELIVKAVAYGLPASKEELNSKIYNFDKTYFKTGENIFHRSLLNIIEKGDSHDRTFFLALRVLKERIKNNKISPEAVEFLIWHNRTVPGNESIWNIAKRRNNITAHVIDELNENWGGKTRVDGAKPEIVRIDPSNRRSMRTISPTLATTSNDSSTFTPEASILNRGASASALARDAVDSPILQERNSRRMSGSRESPFSVSSSAFSPRNSGRKQLATDSPQTVIKSSPFSTPKPPVGGLSANSLSGKSNLNMTSEDVFVIKRKPSTLNNDVKQRLLFEEALSKQQQQPVEQDEY